MDLRLEVQGDDRDAMALSRWLRDERELRGCVRQQPGPMDPEAMGTMTDIVVPLATAVVSGALTPLAESLVTFVRQRKSKVTIEVGSECRITVTGGDNPAALAEKLARIAIDER
ncbi:effector-associated constant component EACC1 [Paractinoplanes abujensis]|uniref:Uncharacterized protein n=1 Tax=Paractinoplanes abujensis TaxID=882441 RepID=A0A7W7CTC1_9ACTN|nr:hypothetical protein [Actinoplanes abujensis]MBB4693994.1 hypothetical protein [Actinoplanes abujensis]